MSTTVRPRLTFLTQAALVAAAGLLVVYSGRADVGLYYDDYHFIRPWSAVDLHRVWYGSWDPTGIESVFFRPLTAYFFAARFWALGLNAPAMHAVSLAAHGLCAVLAALVIRRERVQAPVALLGAWLYAVYPVFPYAQVSWLTNQMHLVESMCVLAAVLLWQSVRDRAWFWSVPLVGLAGVVFLVKEDGVMLLPALAIAGVLRAAIARGGSVRRSLIGVALAGAAAAALFLWRYDRLGTLGGHGRPDQWTAVGHYAKGIKSTLFLWPTRRPWAAVGSAIALVPLAALLAVYRRGHRLVWFAGAAIAAMLIWNLGDLSQPRADGYPLVTWQSAASGVTTAVVVLGTLAALFSANRPSLFLIGLGLTLVAVFDLPFVLVVKREQYQVVG